MNDQSPYELGVDLGAGWAKMMRANRIALRDPLADPVTMVATESEIPPAVRSLVMRVELRELLDASEDPNAEQAFWSGFVAGVRGYLAEQTDYGMGDN